MSDLNYSTEPNSFSRYSYIFKLACVSGEEFLRPARASQQLGREHGNRRVAGSDVAVIQPPRRLQMLFRVADSPLKLYKNIAGAQLRIVLCHGNGTMFTSFFRAVVQFYGAIILYCRRGAAFRTGRVVGSCPDLCQKNVKKACFSAIMMLHLT